MLKKGTAVFVCLAFLVTSVFMPQAKAEVSPLPVTSYSSLVNDLTAIALPKEIGKIRETYHGTSDQIVVLIQDAHSIPDAQRSIRSAIDHFQTKYGISIVGLEGASESLDPQIFKSFPDKELLRKTFETYAQRGELTGGAAASLFNASSATYHGIEDWPLYEEGVSYFLKAMGMEKEIMARIDPMVVALNKEKETVYTKELLETDQLLASFGENKADLVQILKNLNQYQQPPQGSELAVLFEEIKLAQNHGVGDQELQIEVKKIAALAASALKNQPNSIAIRKELQQFNGEFQDFQTGSLTPQAFALCLKELVRKYKIKVKVSRKLASLVENQKRLRDIEGTRLFDELKSYIEAVTEKLVGDSPVGARDSIRKMIVQSKELDLLKRLARLELSFEEWGKIQKLILQLDLWTLTPERIISRDKISALLGKMEAHLAFYRVAEKRDQAFLKNIQALMEKRVQTSSVLVAGGFHTEGLTQSFKAKGISYVLVVPQIGSIPEEPLYREHMQGQVSWSDYFEVKGGKVNLYDAFVRATRDKLLKDSGPESRVPNNVRKEWRDQLIRDLSAEGRITDAADYTRFIDEISEQPTTYNAQQLKEQWLASIDRLGDGLKKLLADGLLSESSILQLIKTITIPEPVLAASLTKGAEIDAKLVKGGTSLSLDLETKEQAATRPEILKENIKSVPAAIQGNSETVAGVEIGAPGNTPKPLIRSASRAVKLEDGFTIVTTMKINASDLSARLAELPEQGHKGLRIKEDGSFEPGDWSIYESSLDQVAKDFNQAGIDFVQDIVKRARQVKREGTGRKMKVVDWGCGNARALMDLAAVLEAEDLRGSVELFGFADLIAPEWKKASLLGIKLILDSSDHFQKYFDVGSIEILFSYSGLHHLGNQESYDQYTNYLRSLRPLMSRDGYLIHNKFGNRISFADYSAEDREKILRDLSENYKVENKGDVLLLAPRSEQRVEKQQARVVKAVPGAPYDIARFRTFAVLASNWFWVAFTFVMLQRQLFVSQIRQGSFVEVGMLYMVLAMSAFAGFIVFTCLIRIFYDLLVYEPLVSFLKTTPGAAQSVKAGELQARADEMYRALKEKILQSKGEDPVLKKAVELVEGVRPEGDFEKIREGGKDGNTILVPFQILMPVTGLRKVLYDGFFRYLVIRRAVGIYYAVAIQGNLDAFERIEAGIPAGQRLEDPNRFARVYWTIRGQYEVLKRSQWYGRLFGLENLILIPYNLVILFHDNVRLEWFLEFMGRFKGAWLMMNWIDHLMADASVVTRKTQLLAKNDQFGFLSSDKKLLWDILEPMTEPQKVEFLETLYRVLEKTSKIEESSAYWMLGWLKPLWTKGVLLEAFPGFVESVAVTSSAAQAIQGQNVGDRIQSFLGFFRTFADRLEDANYPKALFQRMKASDLSEGNRIFEGAFFPPELGAQQFKLGAQDRKRPEARNEKVRVRGGKTTFRSSRKIVRGTPMSGREKALYAVIALSLLLFIRGIADFFFVGNVVEIKHPPGRESKPAAIKEKAKADGVKNGSVRLQAANGRGGAVEAPKYLQVNLGEIILNNNEMRLMAWDENNMPVLVPEAQDAANMENIRQRLMDMGYGDLNEVQVPGPAILLALLSLDKDQDPEVRWIQRYASGDDGLGEKTSALVQEAAQKAMRLLIYYGLSPENGDLEASLKSCVDAPRPDDRDVFNAAMTRALEKSSGSEDVLSALRLIQSSTFEGYGWLYPNEFPGAEEAARYLDWKLEPERYKEPLPSTRAGWETLINMTLKDKPANWGREASTSDGTIQEVRPENRAEAREKRGLAKAVIQTLLEKVFRWTSKLFMTRKSDLWLRGSLARDLFAEGFARVPGSSDEYPQYKKGKLTVLVKNKRGTPFQAPFLERLAYEIASKAGIQTSRVWFVKTEDGQTRAGIEFWEGSEPFVEWDGVRQVIAKQSDLAKEHPGTLNVFPVSFDAWIPQLADPKQFVRSDLLRYFMSNGDSPNPRQIQIKKLASGKYEARMIDYDHALFLSPLNEDLVREHLEAGKDYYLKYAQDTLETLAALTDEEIEGLTDGILDNVSFGASEKELQTMRELSNQSLKLSRDIFKEKLDAWKGERSESQGKITGRTKNRAEVRNMPNPTEPFSQGFHSYEDRPRYPSGRDQSLSSPAAAKSSSAPVVEDVKMASFSREDFPIIQSLGGSTGAWLVRDKRDQSKKVCKFGTSPGQAINEGLANFLYREAGVDVPQTEVVIIDGRPAILIEFIEGLKMTPQEMAGSEGMLDGFAADAWLANWDVTGTGKLHELNIIRSPEGKPFRIDNGGAMEYRAMGEPKGAAWGTRVAEIESMRQRSPGASVFGKLTDEQVAIQVKYLQMRITPKKIDEALEKSGYPQSRRWTMQNLLMTRLKNMDDWATTILKKSLVDEVNGTRTPFKEYAVSEKNGRWQVGEAVDLTRADPSKLRGRVSLSSSEEAILYDHKAYVVWTRGPKKGMVYQIYEEPSAEALAQVPSADAIKKEVLRRVSELCRLEPKRLSEMHDLKTGELWGYLLELFYGGNGHLPLRVARFYNKDQNDLFQEIQDTGLKDWLQQESQKVGLDPRLHSFVSTGEERLLREVVFTGKPLTGWSSEAGEDDFFGGPNEFFDPEDPGVLYTETYSSALSGIVQFGLASYARLKKEDFPKTTGETRGDGISASGGDVSFWGNSPEEAMPISCEHAIGAPYGLEFPMTFAISKEKARTLPGYEEFVRNPKAYRNGLYQGMENEFRVKDFVPLEIVTHVFVPYFEVENVRLTLKQHGYSHMKVLPLGFVNKQPQWEAVKTGRAEIRDGKEAVPQSKEQRSARAVTSGKRSVEESPAGNALEKLLRALRNAGAPDFDEQVVKYVPQWEKAVKGRQHDGQILSRHTRNVLEKLYSLQEFPKLDASEQDRLLLAVLLHDIGKPVSEEYAVKGRFDRGHAVSSEKIAREVLADPQLSLSPESIEIIATIILNHDFVTGLLRADKYPDADPVPIREGLWKRIPAGFPLELLKLMNKADSLTFTEEGFRIIEAKFDEVYQTQGQVAAGKAVPQINETPNAARSSSVELVPAVLAGTEYDHLVFSNGFSFKVSNAIGFRAADVDRFTHLKEEPTQFVMVGDDFAEHPEKYGVDPASFYRKTADGKIVSCTGEEFKAEAEKMDKDKIFHAIRMSERGFVAVDYMISRTNLAGDEAMDKSLPELVARIQAQKEKLKNNAYDAEQQLRDQKKNKADYTQWDTKKKMFAVRYVDPYAPFSEEPLTPKEAQKRAAEYETENKQIDGAIVVLNERLKNDLSAADAQYEAEFLTHEPSTFVIDKASNIPRSEIERAAKNAALLKARVFNKTGGGRYLKSEIALVAMHASDHPAYQGKLVVQGTGLAWSGRNMLDFSLNGIASTGGGGSTDVWRNRKYFYVVPLADLVAEPENAMLGGQFADVLFAGNVKLPSTVKVFSSAEEAIKYVNAISGYGAMPISPRGWEGYDESEEDKFFVRAGLLSGDHDNTWLGGGIMGDVNEIGIESFYGNYGYSRQEAMDRSIVISAIGRLSNIPGYYAKETVDRDKKTLYMAGYSPSSDETMLALIRESIKSRKESGVSYQPPDTLTAEDVLAYIKDKPAFKKGPDALKELIALTQTPPTEARSLGGGETRPEARAEMRQPLLSRRGFLKGLGAAAVVVPGTSVARSGEKVLFFSYDWKVFSGEYTSNDAQTMSLNGKKLSELKVVYDTGWGHAPQAISINANGAVRVHPVQLGRNYVMGPSVYLGRWFEKNGSPDGRMHDYGFVDEVTGISSTEGRLEILLTMKARHAPGEAPAWTARQTRLVFYKPERADGTVRIDVDFEAVANRPLELDPGKKPSGDDIHPVQIVSNHSGPGSSSEGKTYYDSTDVRLLKEDGSTIETISLAGALPGIEGYGFLKLADGKPLHSAPVAAIALLNKKPSEAHQLRGQEPPTVVMVPSQGSWRANALMTYEAGKTKEDRDNVNAWLVSPTQKAKTLSGEVFMSFHGSLYFVPPGDLDQKRLRKMISEGRPEARVGNLWNRIPLRAVVAAGFMGLAAAAAEGAALPSSESIKIVQRKLKMEHVDGKLGSDTYRKLQAYGGFQYKSGKWDAQTRAMFEWVLREAQDSGKTAAVKSSKAPAPKTPVLEVPAPEAIPAAVVPAKVEMPVATKIDSQQLDELVGALIYMDIITPADGDEVKTNKTIREIKTKKLQRKISAPETGDYWDGVTRDRFAKEKALRIATEAAASRLTAESSAAALHISVTKEGLKPISPDNEEVIKLGLQDYAKLFNQLREGSTYRSQLWPEASDKDLISLGIVVELLNREAPTEEQKAELQKVREDVARKNYEEMLSGIARVEGGEKYAANQLNGPAGGTLSLEPASAVDTVRWAGNSTNAIVRSAFFNGLTPKQTAFAKSLLKKDANNYANRSAMYTFMQNRAIHIRLATFYLDWKLYTHKLYLPSANNLEQQAATYQIAWAPGIFEYPRTLALFIYADAVCDVLDKLSRGEKLTARDRNALAQAKRFSLSAESIAVDMRNAQTEVSRKKNFHTAGDFMVAARQKYLKLLVNGNQFDLVPHRALVMLKLEEEIRLREVRLKAGLAPQTHQAVPTVAEVQAMGKPTVSLSPGVVPKTGQGVPTVAERKAKGKSTIPLAMSSMGRAEARSEQRRTPLVATADLVVQALKPGERVSLSQTTAREVLKWARTDLPGFMAALKAAVNEAMANVSAQNVQVTRDMADSMIKWIIRALERSHVEGNLAVGFDLEPGQNFFEALMQLRAGIGTAVFSKAMARGVPRNILKGMRISTVSSFSGYKPSRSSQNKVVPVLANLSAQYFSVNEALFGVGVETDEITGEPFLEVVENVVRIASGLLIADRIKSPSDLNNVPKMEEIRAELLKMLFKLDAGSGVLSMKGRNLIVHRGLLRQFIREYQASSEVNKAA